MLFIVLTHVTKPHFLFQLSTPSPPTDRTDTPTTDTTVATDTLAPLALVAAVAAMSATGAIINLSYLISYFIKSSLSFVFNSFIIPVILRTVVKSIEVFRC